MRHITKIVLAIATIALIAFGINAFAHGGWGMGGGHHGRGWHHGGGYGYGPGYDDRMTPEEYRQFEQQREAFLNDTRDLRASLYDKQEQLQNELVKENPDAAKASKLQKEISDLQAQFDQKRIDHMIEMRKLNPNMGRGYGGYGRGGGPMMGYGHHGMGYGRGGGGYCWR